MAQDSTSIPALLLKTKSTPGDSYEDTFAAAGFNAEFVPVLQHQFLDDGMSQIKSLLESRSVGKGPDCAYGGLIFTSQRAVEAFTKLVEDGRGDDQWPFLQDIPVYSVGPATTRALKSVPQIPPLQIFGEHTGNGEALAHFMLEHYPQWHSGRSTLPPLLFLVGEQRRDIIPKTLMDSSLAADRRIEVTETVVYGTGVMESFPSDFERVLDRTKSAPSRWVVVFSPTGCESMLRSLGLLNDEGNLISTSTGHASNTFVATIGPTTRDYLTKTFGFVPDVCAEKPSPEGVLAGIAGFKGRT